MQEKLCPECGAEYVGEPKFCSECGARLMAAADVGPLEEQQDAPSAQLDESLEQGGGTAEPVAQPQTLGPEPNDGKAHEKPGDSTRAGSETSGGTGETPETYTDPSISALLEAKKEERDKRRAAAAEEREREKAERVPFSEQLANNPAAKVTLGVLVALLVVALAPTVLSSICFHDWAEATCTRPETCTKCGDTRGDALGHSLDEGVAVEATCTDEGCTLYTCSVCGAEFEENVVEALGHDVATWETVKKATCTSKGEKQGTCKRCGETVSKSVAKEEHTLGSWEVVEDYEILPEGLVIPGIEQRKCTVCGEVIKERDYEIELTVSQENALETAASYLDYTAFSKSGLIDQLEYEGYSTEDAEFAAEYCGADWNEQAALCAESYLDYSSFSRSGLIDQLEFEGFTYEQAVYGVDSVGL